MARNIAACYCKRPVDCNPYAVDFEGAQNYGEGQQTFLNNSKQNAPNYNLYHLNCAQFCERALQAGGVKNVPNDVTPHGLVQDLKGSPSMMDYIRMMPIPPIF